jgi:uncharacterized membrane protein
MTEGEQSSTGLQANLAGLLCYVLGLLSGLLFFLIEKKSKFVKFHALQSMLLSVALFVISLVLAFVPVINEVAALVLPILSLILWIFLMVKAYQGQTFKLPMIGDVAEKNSTISAA